jgi:hypothetical protein
MHMRGITSDAARAKAKTVVTREDAPWLEPCRPVPDHVHAQMDGQE